MPRAAKKHRPSHQRTARPPDRRPSATQRGYDAAWRKLRLLVLAEQPICQSCKRRAARHVDHVDGNVHNLTRSNLMPLCPSCHAKKTVAHDGGLGRVKARKTHG